MNRQRLRARKSIRKPIKVYGLTPSMRAFVREFQAKLDAMQVVDVYADNVIPFPGREK
jgi:hypothetical protein